MRLTFTLNDEPVTLDEVPEEMLLIDLLRDRLRLTGTKRGCDSGVCGTCSVLIDGRTAKACRTAVAKVAGRHVTTIEGVGGTAGDLSDLQAAFLAHGAVQCGYCTPAMVLAGEALLRRNLSPTRDEIRRAIAGVLCRCTGYQQIVDAIEATAATRRADRSRQDAGRS
jgi:aerobic-type carbon monoxide dehydrogenase small subunit (CoxS/CutS family)